MLFEVALGVCSIRVLAKNHGDPYYEPPIVVHGRKLVHRATLTGTNNYCNNNRSPVMTPQKTVTVFSVTIHALPRQPFLSGKLNGLYQKSIGHSMKKLSTIFYRYVIVCLWTLWQVAFIVSFGNRLLPKGKTLGTVLFLITSPIQWYKLHSHSPNCTEVTALSLQRYSRKNINIIIIVATV